LEKESPLTIKNRHTLLPWVTVIGCMLIFIGFVASRAAASIGMITLLVAPFVLGSPKGVFKNYLRRKELYILSLYFIIVLVSGLYSADKNDWLNWVRIKLPYVALPIAFAGIQKLDTKKFTLVLYGFMLTFFVSTTAILINYFAHYAAINEELYKGGALPIPFSHIRYTLMLAFAFFCAIYLYGKKLYVLNANEKWLHLLFAAFAFVALHILAVRSGLLALYLGLLYVALFFVFRQRKYLVGVAAVALVIVLPFAAYHFVPSFHNKISYMEYDIHQIRDGKYNNLSDGIRILSTQIGIDIWKQSPVIGIGAGDLRTEVNKVYIEQYPNITEPNRKVPHNQFVWVLASTGIVGLALFLAAFFVPLFTKKLYKHWPVMVLHLIIFSSFLTEDTLEEQMGTGFYLIFLLLLMNHFNADE